MINVNFLFPEERLNLASLNSEFESKNKKILPINVTDETVFNVDSIIENSAGESFAKVENLNRMKSVISNQIKMKGFGDTKSTQHINYQHKAEPEEQKTTIPALAEIQKDTGVLVSQLLADNKKLTIEVGRLRSEVDKLTLENEQLKVNEKTKPTLELPKVAPELYAERKDRNEDAISFFRRVYKPWLEAGVVIYQFNLRGKNGIDPQLMKGIENKLQSKAEIAAIVPRKREKVDKELYEVDMGKIAKQERESARVRRALSRRK